MTSPEPDADAIHLYWRPGCGFCGVLRRGLDQAGIDRIEHDIWDDPGAAAVVRRFANGNETVPTVVVGDVGLVNPSVKQLLGHVERHAPHLLPDGYEPPPPNLLARLFGS